MFNEVPQAEPSLSDSRSLERYADVSSQEGGLIAPKRRLLWPLPQHHKNLLRFYFRENQGMSTRMRVLGGLALTSLLAAPAFADIATSAHDFSGVGGVGNGQICVVCHAPHGNQNATGAMLWNRAATTREFTAYTSPTLDATPGLPGATSMVCLSCHDGTIAVDSYGDVTTGTQYITTFGLAAFTADLGQDHPVGIAYSPGTGANQDAELKAVTAPFGLAPTIDDALIGGKVECATCHDVHNTLSDGNPKLLNVTSDGSAICLACHAK